MRNAEELKVWGQDPGNECHCFKEGDKQWHLEQGNCFLYQPGISLSKRWLGPKLSILETWVTTKLLMQLQSCGARAQASVLTQPFLQSWRLTWASECSSSAFRWPRDQETEIFHIQTSQFFFQINYVLAFSNFPFVLLQQRSGRNILRKVSSEKQAISHLEKC